MGTNMLITPIQLPKTQLVVPEIGCTPNFSQVRLTLSPVLEANNPGLLMISATLYIYIFLVQRLKA